MKLISKISIAFFLSLLLTSCNSDSETSAELTSIVSISPTAGTKNTEVTISGKAFGSTLEAVQVFFNGSEAAVLSVQDNQIVALVPSQATTGNITVVINNEVYEGPEFIYLLSGDVSTFAGSTSGYANGTGANAQFNEPYDVAVDANGNVLVADRENHRIRKISPEGEVSNFAGNGTQGFADGTGENAQFYFPEGIATDAAGNVYVADTFNNSIRKITPNGEVTTLAGSTDDGDIDGNGSSARFERPADIATDTQGNIYVADSFNNKIKKISPSGQVITLAGSGERGDADGPGSSAAFNTPSAVAVDLEGNIYVADRNNDKIKKITPDGNVSTFAGSGEEGEANGAANIAQFNTPNGIAVDTNGNVMVSDYGNNTVRVISVEMLVYNLAGGGNFGEADGIGEAASFRRPRGLAFDASGTLYVADEENSRIRKITID